MSSALIANQAHANLDFGPFSCGLDQTPCVRATKLALVILP